MSLRKKIEVDELVFAEIPFGLPAMDTMVDLRNRVLRVPLNLQFNADDIASEWSQHHFGLFSMQHELIACAILKPAKDPNEIKMRQVAVEPLHQKKGVGKKLIDNLEKWSKEQGYGKIVLHAREVSIPFYEKAGYKKIGQPFEEVGLDHFFMQKSLL